MRNQENEDRLLQAVAGYKHDPLGFVLFAFPWGEPGALQNFTGPQPWQVEELENIARIVRGATDEQVALAELLGDVLTPGKGKGRLAVASGKGIGKSALVAWIVLWAMSTFPGTKGVLTAGTEPQLRTKTWPEVNTWYQRLICKHWFHITATSLYSVDLECEKTWRFDAIPWNAARMEAFAGLHNLGKRIVVIFDEASQIDDVIWNTTDGIFTDADTEVLFAVFGNPTRGQGAFFECFNRFRHRWLGRQIDSRKVPISDKKMIQEWIDDYGIDSDYVRMNVLGQFPRVSSMQFIANDVVAAARNREVSAHITDALIMGVDVARFGDDESVIAFRKGRDARSIPWLKFRKLDTMALASAVAEAHERLKADACFVDGGGVGGGVVDRLRSLGFTVRDVQFGAAPDRADVDKDATRYANKRAEIWGYMRESLPGLAIPDDDALAADLTNVLYGFKDGTKGAAIVLEKKEHMKKRGMASPDRGDALALTYAYPVMPRGWAGGEHRMHMTDNRHQAQIDYDPLA